MTKLYVAYELENKKFMNGVYAHGNLQDMAGIDYVYADDDFDRDTERIEDVTAILPSGEERQARLFFWHRRTFSQAGLVVEIGDTDFMKDAQKKFDERAKDI